MHDIGKRSAVLENVAGCVRLDAYIYINIIYIYIYIYIRSCNKMAALGYVYTLGKQTSRSPEGFMSGNATRAEFLVVQMPPRSSCMTGIKH